MVTRSTVSKLEEQFGYSNWTITGPLNLLIVCPEYIAVIGIFH